ncbi:hypothetical protein EWM64_g6489 [Hericium alpestre]|uniref:Chromatin elongation factor SPT5 n=1 Tax=Hericium alpestre TaxID=135208 RepID=A0A4Y9ZTF2_9AGAM|nr:hypothetical protein EWM64_g6489 [Hericium alpestre]
MPTPLDGNISMNWPQNGARSASEQGHLHATEQGWFRDNTGPCHSSGEGLPGWDHNGPKFYADEGSDLPPTHATGETSVVTPAPVPAEVHFPPAVLEEIMQAAQVAAQAAAEVHLPPAVLAEIKQAVEVAAETAAHKAVLEGLVHLNLKNHGSLPSASTATKMTKNAPTAEAQTTKKPYHLQSDGNGNGNYSEDEMDDADEMDEADAAFSPNPKNIGRTVKHRTAEKKLLNESFRKYLHEKGVMSETHAPAPEPPLTEAMEKFRSSIGPGPDIDAPRLDWRETFASRWNKLIIGMITDDFLTLVKDNHYPLLVYNEKTMAPRTLWELCINKVRRDVQKYAAQRKAEIAVKMQQDAIDGRRSEIDIIKQVFSRVMRESHPGVFSAFEHPHIPGVIFIEACSRPDVLSVLDKFVTVQHKKPPVLIPVGERTMLFASKVDIPIQVGQWVHVLCGSYKGDVGYVKDTEISALTLVLVPQIQRKNQPKADLQTNPENKKQKRSSHPEAHIWPFQLVLDEWGSQIKGSAEKFQFRNKTYVHGVLLKKFDIVAVEPVNSLEHAEAIGAFLAVRELNIDGSFHLQALLKRSQDSLCVGDRVAIISGDQTGLTGNITNIEHGVATVDAIDVSLPLSIQVPITSLRRSFHPRDSVKVEGGHEDGLVIAVEGDFLTFLDRLTHREVQVKRGDLRRHDEVASTSRFYGAHLIDSELVGKPAVVIKGNFKGYRALIKAVTQQDFIVELEAKMASSRQMHTLPHDYISFSAEHLRALESHLEEVARPSTPPPQDSAVSAGVWDPSNLAGEESVLQAYVRDMPLTLFNRKAVFKIKGTKGPNGFEGGQYEDFVATALPAKDQASRYDRAEIVVSMAHINSKIPQKKSVPIRFLEPHPVCVGLPVLILGGEFAGEIGDVIEEHEYQYTVRVHAARVLVVDKPMVIQVKDP